jgi:hypothetical protein
MSSEELEAFAQQLAPHGSDYALWRKLARDSTRHQGTLQPCPAGRPEQQQPPDTR